MLSTCQELYDSSGQIECLCNLDLREVSEQAVFSDRVVTTKKQKYKVYQIQMSIDNLDISDSCVER